MDKDPATPLLVGRGFLATANTVIDCRKAKIVVGQGVTRSIFRVKEIDIREEEVPNRTTLGKRESYTPRPSMDGIGARPLTMLRRTSLITICQANGKSLFARDAELNPFKDALVFRRMVELLEVIPINLKGNMCESKELIENRID
uniref:Uncharacterized protein n=1 Tax=Tanacetum cinerariifolium TaxID=118510 RepID=A0A699I190_TANCI|nr:hypothetical protein [Tanacetum cinerariifolium]